MKNKKSCCVTGLPIFELPLEFSNLAGKASTKLSVGLSEEINTAIDQGFLTFVTGDICGIDLIARWSIEALLWRSQDISTYYCNDISEKLNDFDKLILVIDSASSFDSAQVILEKAKLIESLEVIVLDVRRYM